MRREREIECCNALADLGWFEHIFKWLSWAGTPLPCPRHESFYGNMLYGNN